jgi:ribokinase
LQQGAERGLRIVFNPAPMEAAVLDYPLAHVSIFIVNEVEGQALSGAATPEAMLAEIRRRYPAAAVVLTLGASGVIYADADQQIQVPAEAVQAVDTTAAGDTFTGYFLAALAAGEAIERALCLATRAAALCVTRPGAAASIPTRAEVWID